MKKNKKKQPPSLGAIASQKLFLRKDKEETIHYVVQIASSQSCQC